jgi:hypothetical protein
MLGSTLILMEPIRSDEVVASGLLVFFAGRYGVYVNGVAGVQSLHI